MLHVTSLLPEAIRGWFGAAAELERPSRPTSERWSFEGLAGRLVEVSGAGASAALTYAFALVADAQARGENVAWVSARADGFFPPDAAEGGIDLGALPVVLAGEAARAGRAASHLLRSGAFGLVVVDLGADVDLPAPLVTRLAGLAQHHGAIALCLTDKPDDAPSLGSLVSFHAHARRVRRASGGFDCELAVAKDKRAGPGARVAEVCRGPAGLS